MSTMTKEQWAALREDHEMAYFRGELATSSPQSYSIKEMREISEAMDASTAEVEEAMRKDFAAMPPHAQAQMMELLAANDPGNLRFWEDLLLGFGDLPDSPPEEA